MAFSKRKYQRRNSGPPRIRAGMLRVERIDEEAGAVFVTPTESQAEHLEMTKGQAVELRIRKAEKSARQPNINDLLGRPGGGSSASMTVAAGSVIRGESLMKEEDGALSVSWLRIGAGLQADANAKANGCAEHARILEGCIRTGRRRLKNGDGFVYAAEVIQPKAAVPAAPSAGAVRPTLESVFARETVGQPTAIIRLSQADGDTVHLRVSPQWREGDQESVSEAIERVLGDERFADAAAEAESAEVIPGQRIAVGRTAGDMLNEAIAASQADPRRSTAAGSSKFDIAEIHPDQRGSSGSNSAAPPSAAQSHLVNELAARRGRDVPDAARRTAAAASEFIHANELQLGYAWGELLVREGYRAGGDAESEPFPLAIGSALRTASGLPLAAISTPATENAASFARTLAREGLERRSAAFEAAAEPAASEESVHVEVAPDGGPEAVRAVEDDSPAPF